MAHNMRSTNNFQRRTKEVIAAESFVFVGGVSICCR